MESTRKLINFNFQWTKTLYQNNLKHIALYSRLLPNGANNLPSGDQIFEQGARTGAENL